MTVKKYLVGIVYMLSCSVTNSYSNSSNYEIDITAKIVPSLEAGIIGKRKRRLRSMYEDGSINVTEIIQTKIENLYAINVQFFESGEKNIFYKRYSWEDEGEHWYGESNNKIDTMNLLIERRQGNNTRVTGSAMHKNKVYSFVTLSDGRVVVTGIDISLFPSEAEPRINRGRERHLNEEDSQIIYSRNEEEGYDDGSIIDIMCVYTREALCNEAEGVDLCDVEKNHAVMDDKCKLAVSETNVAYKESRILTRLRLVYSGYVDINYQESTNFCSMILDLSDGNNEAFQKILHLQNEFKADLVGLVVNNDEFCGCAFNYNGHWKNGYFMTYRRCMTGYFSFAHEAGHSMGCQHDPMNEEDGIGNFAYGYQDNLSEFRTIMAYNCPDKNCPRVQRFSTPNPSIRYAGRKVGTSVQDNARQMNSVRFNVANFRKSGTLNQPTPTPSTRTVLSILPSQSPIRRPSAYPSVQPASAILSNKTISEEECKLGQVSFVLNLQTDSKPRDTSWRLLDMNSNAVISNGNNYNIPNAQFPGAASMCINAGRCFKFIIQDRSGDGLQGDGRYQILINDKIAGSGDSSKNFGYWRQHNLAIDSMPGTNYFRIKRRWSKKDCLWLLSRRWRIRKYCSWKNIQHRCPNTCNSCVFNKTMHL